MLIVNQLNSIPAQATVESAPAGDVQAGDDVTLTIQSRDDNGDAFDVCDDIYDIEISRPDGSVSNEVATYSSNGLYSVTFETIFGGDYDVVITMTNSYTAANGHISTDVDTFTVKAVELPSVPSEATLESPPSTGTAGTAFTVTL